MIWIGQLPQIGGQARKKQIDPKSIDFRLKLVDIAVFVLDVLKLQPTKCGNLLLGRFGKISDGLC